MSRPAPEIDLSTEEKETLLHWMRSTKTERRLVERARVILLAANGLNGKEIAARMETRTARVSDCERFRLARNVAQDFSWRGKRRGYSAGHHSAAARACSKIGRQEKVGHERRTDAQTIN